MEVDRKASFTWSAVPLLVSARSSNCGGRSERQTKTDDIAGGQLDRMRRPFVGGLRGFTSRC